MTGAAKPKGTALDALKERLLTMRDEQLARMIRRGQLPLIATIDAMLAALDEPSAEWEPASRAVVSDDGQTTRLTLYAEDGLVAAVELDPSARSRSPESRSRRRCRSWHIDRPGRLSLVRPLVRAAAGWEPPVVLSGRLPGRLPQGYAPMVRASDSGRTADRTSPAQRGSGSVYASGMQRDGLAAIRHRAGLH
jgi:hypothetical protein